jgi:hypothetical protein
MMGGKPGQRNAASDNCPCPRCATLEQVTA